jgi:hypothetical protein
MVNGTIREYGTFDGTMNSSTLISWDNVDSGHNYMDLVNMVANVYYKDTDVHRAMNRDEIQSGCSNSGQGCFGGPSGWDPDVPFMFSNMEGKVNPYRVISGLPAAPTNLRIVQ